MTNANAIALIERYRATGCEVVFNTLYSQYADVIHFFVRQYGSKGNILEIKSIGSMVVYNAIESKYDVTSSMQFLTYLMRTIKYRVIDFLRAERNKNNIVELTDNVQLQLSSQIPPLSVAVEENIARTEMERLSQFLTERELEVYNLIKQGYTQVEIARKLNITSSRVSWLKSVIIQFMRDNLYKRGTPSRASIQTMRYIKAGIRGTQNRRINYYSYANRFLD